MDNISECMQCHVQGTNYVKKCKSCVIKKDDNETPNKCYLFNIGNCVPALDTGELTSLPDAQDQTFSCFSCSFSKMKLSDLLNNNLPYRYIYLEDPTRVWEVKDIN